MPGVIADAGRIGPAPSCTTTMMVDQQRCTRLDRFSLVVSSAAQYGPASSTPALRSSCLWSFCVEASTSLLLATTDFTRVCRASGALMV
uniref:Uncharacterized protein n=1 Tax=Setaria italica TaxID=4555 RepID=K3XNR3_SETIT